MERLRAAGWPVAIGLLAALLVLNLLPRSTVVQPSVPGPASWAEAVRRASPAVVNIYTARVVRRAYIPKTDGRQRPLGVPTLEDKIVQRALVAVLNAIYEEDFLISSGSRTGFGPDETRTMRWMHCRWRLAVLR